MPSPPKDRPSGRLGRLLAALRPSRAGPLPVQTGFPTSLADLVVKNHGRLKKQPSPSSKRGKRGAAASTSPSSPTSPSPSPPPASPPPPAAAVAVSPSDRPRPADLPPAQPRRRGKGGGFGLGLGFLAVSGVVSLALLVIWSKKVVAAVTVASFSLYLLESVRSSSLPSPRRRPRPAVAERRLCLDGRGRVSPIREVDAETEPSRPSCSDSDRGSDACILAVEESSVVLDESSNPKAKAKKKSWKKLLAASAKKLHRGRRSKEAGSSGSSFRSEGDRADDATARGGGNAKAADSSGSRRVSASQTGAPAEDAAAAAAKEEADSSRGSRRSQGVEVDADAAPVEIDASVGDLIEEEEEEGEEKQAGIRFPALVLVAIVLIGLVAGKVVALALTVLCSAFLSSVSIQRSPCRGCGGGGGCSQGRRLELSMS